MSVVIIEARSIVRGSAEGYTIISNEPINLLAMLDMDGRIIDERYPLYNQSIAGKILVFPNAVGSSVGAYTIYRLKRKGKAPLGVICKEADITTASGCAIANIPLLDRPRCRLDDLKGKIVIDGSFIKIHP